MARRSCLRALARLTTLGAAAEQPCTRLGASAFSHLLLQDAPSALRRLHNSPPAFSKLASSLKEELKHEKEHYEK